MSGSMLNQKSPGPLALALSISLAACSGGGAPMYHPPNDGGGTIQTLPEVPFAVDFGDVAIVTPTTALPEVPPLPHVTAYVEGDTLRVMAFPIAEARDYRIYPLPDDADVVALGGTDFAIDQATYRCGGMRYAPRIATDSESFDTTYTGHSTVNGMVAGVMRTTEDATLGYVSLTAGTGLVPLYALGSAFQSGDVECGHQMQFRASRLKRYTTSSSDRQAMLTAGWRDDGIVGYVPSAAGDGIVQIYEHRETPGDAAADPGRVLYFGESERAERDGAREAFLVHSSVGADRYPLMRAYYDYVPCSGRQHDELVVGEARFQQIVHQGPTPFPNVQWPGLRGRGRYVIEALDALCPYQGLAVTMSDAAGDSAGVVRRTEAEIRTAEGHGQFYINGQGDPGNRPRVLARLIVEAEPVRSDVEDMTFHEMFTDASLFDGLNVEHGNYVDVWQNDRVSVSSIIFTWYSFGIVHDELWWGFMETNGSNGKFRISPKQTFDLADASFVHATMNVDTVVGDRRYPQIIITDRDVPLPIQSSFLPEDMPQNLAMGNSIVVQPFGLWPGRVDIEYCQHRDWDVNNQCPRYDTNQVEGSSPTRLIPHTLLSDESALGWRTRLDVFASTHRVYVFANYRPYACADLPASGLASGPGHVTFGSVLYHAGAHPDVNSYDFYEFHNRYMVAGDRRFYDDLGIQGGVAPPTWDETAYPCATTLEME